MEQLDTQAKISGVPRAILSDQGSDLTCGIRQFCQQHPETATLSDISHHAAILLKRRLENNERWKSFCHQAPTDEISDRHYTPSYAALLGETTAELIGQALEQVPIKQVWAWCRHHLGTTLQSQRVAARRAVQSCSPPQQKPEEP